MIRLKRVENKRMQIEMRQLVDTTGLTGKVVLRGEEAYESARTMWNRAIDKYPLVICYCENEEDVRNSILWAKKHEMGIRIRSGGHHYDGFSSADDVLVIDVSRMNQITINEADGIVTIGGGTRNRELYEFLCTRGYPFPGGGCPTVGVVGFALGGGWGFSGRFLGLGCDAIWEVQLINGNGEKLIASQSQNPELFWALKGSGGGQFGIVTSLSFRLPEKIQNATLIKLDYHGATRDEQLKVFALFQEMIQSACDEVNFKASFYNSVERGQGMYLLGIYYGDMSGAHEIIAPFVKLGRNIALKVETMSVLDINRWIQDTHPDYEHYKSSGRFVNEALTMEQIRTILTMIDQKPNGSIYTAISCYGMGGQMGRVSREEASFYYRDSIYIIGFQSMWDDNKYRQANRDWFAERFRILEGMTPGSFVNFPAGEINEYKTAYYGAHRAKLESIRKQYDPQGIFAFEQGL